MNIIEKDLVCSFYNEETRRTQSYLTAVKIYKARVNHYLSWHPWAAVNVCPEYKTREATVEDIIHTINVIKVKDNTEVTRLKTSTNYILRASAIVNHLDCIRHLMLHHNITREDLHTMDEAVKEAVGVSNVFPKCMLNSDFKAYH